MISCYGLKLAQRRGLVTRQEFLLLGLQRLAELLESHQNLSRLRRAEEWPAAAAAAAAEAEAAAAVSAKMGTKVPAQV